jgi:diacylglycerol kinase (ATP)
MQAGRRCVIWNPAAGRGRAGARLARLRTALAQHAEFWPTAGPGHAEELALKAAGTGFDIVAAAGGDGTVHEVASGLVRAGRPDVTMEIFPVGSANDYAHTLGLDADWWCADPDPTQVRPVDMGVVQSPDGRLRHFINGLGLGFNGAVTLEVRRIRRLQGLALYGAALLRALWSRYEYPPMAVTLDGQTRRVETLALTLALGRREGNFVLAPNALVDDGLFDYLHAGPLPRWELLLYLPGMITGRLPTDHPRVWMGRCREARVESTSPLAIHLDGEFFCEPENNVRRIDVRILPGALRVRRKV